VRVGCWLLLRTFANFSTLLSSLFVLIAAKTTHSKAVLVITTFCLHSNSCRCLTLKLSKRSRAHQPIHFGISEPLLNASAYAALPSIPAVWVAHHHAFIDRS
jgi:hypothetical protein